MGRGVVGRGRGMSEAPLPPLRRKHQVEVSGGALGIGLPGVTECPPAKTPAPALKDRSVVTEKRVQPK